MDRINYPVVFYFELSFKGVDAAFQEVTGISKQMGIEEVSCGGENRFKYRLPTVTTNENLILKRAMVPVGSKLLAWCADCLDNGLATKIETRDITVSLLDANRQVSCKWTFYNAYPIKYSVSDLHSQKNELLIESIEMAYTYFNIAQY